MILVNGKEVEFEQFPNGETLLKHESLQGGIHLIIANVFFKYENDSDLIKLMLLKNYIDNYASRTTLTITYMPYSRMDRSENDSPFTLKYVANFINSLGFAKVRIIEPHSDVTTALVDRSEAKYINFNLIEKVKEKVGFSEAEDYIMFPDAGAQKRYSKMKVRNQLVGNKVRDFETGEIKGLDLISNSDGTGDTVIIVDDLSSYGGTFKHSAIKLRKEGYKYIYLLVAHAENSIFKGDLFNHVDKVFTTDSILTEHRSWENIKYMDEERLIVFPTQVILNEI